MRKAVVARLLEGDGRTPRAQRRAAFDNAQLAAPLSIATHVEDIAPDEMKRRAADCAARADGARFLDRRRERRGHGRRRDSVVPTEHRGAERAGVRRI
jgi:hypothetical protein